MHVSPRKSAAGGTWRRLASQIAGVSVGLLIGLSSFGSAFASANAHYVVLGVTRDALLGLLFLSVGVGCVARRYWLWALFAQLVGFVPGVCLLMLGEPQTAFERWSIPALLALVSLVGILLGRLIGNAIARLRHPA